MWKHLFYRHILFINQLFWYNLIYHLYRRKEIENIFSDKILTLICLHSCVSITFPLRFITNALRQSEALSKGWMLLIFLEEAALDIFILTSHLCLTLDFSQVAIKSKSPYRVTFITSWQPRDHSALQRDSMIARQNILRPFTPGAVKSARGNINTPAKE